MFRQISGERGGCLPGGRQGGSQRPEENAAAEAAPAVPAALTPPGGHATLGTGLTGPQAQAAPWDPAPTPAFEGHLQLDVSNTWCLEPMVRLSECSGTLSFPSLGSDHELTSGLHTGGAACVVVGQGTRLSRSVPQNWHSSPGPWKALHIRPSAACVPFAHPMGLRSRFLTDSTEHVDKRGFGSVPHGPPSLRSRATSLPGPPR